MSEQTVKYQRVLLKLSGEALAGDAGFGLNPDILNQTAQQIKELVNLGIEVGLVVGGGNLFRGAELSQAGLDRVAGDHMGMLATVMNALALRDALARADVSARVMSAIPMSGVAEPFDRLQAVRHLTAGEPVIFAAGTGNPFFTTDSAACLRGIEIKADLVLKATKVDGIYTADPMKDASATKYQHLTFDEAVDKQLGVMDLTAVCLCRDHRMPLRVFKMDQPGALLSIIRGGDEGTLVEG